MIIGHGDIASALKDKDGFLFFASGVSNSQEKRESEYKRERDLLLKQAKNARVVYFSTLAIFYSATRYVQHKLQMEELVKKHFPSHNIIRLGNITWGKNPNTIINFFKNQIKAGKPLEIRDEYRYIVDKDEFLHWIEMIPELNCEMNIPGKRMKVKEIIDGYCQPGLKIEE